jgi:transposase
MEIYPFLPASLGFRCIYARLDRKSMIIELTPIATEAACPACGQLSNRIHSRYNRILSDLPCMGIPVKLRLQVRRFFCDMPTCPKRTFAERTAAAAAYARKTHRLTEVLIRIGFAIGGEAGSRLSTHLGVATSGDTLLRLIHSTPVVTPTTVCVLGVDDWAWRKGQSYGTLLCDLEQHRLVDLLPERSAETLARWLIDHPCVNIISRDRGCYYAQGAKLGAPQALQVADRFHLLCNLRVTLVRMLDRHSRLIREVVHSVNVSQTSFLQHDNYNEYPSHTNYNSKEASRFRRFEQYSQVIELHKLGTSMRQIARQTGLNRGTVLRYLHAGQFPERAARRYRRQIDSFISYLHKRWEEGCHNASQLTQELSKLGFVGSYYMVRRCVADWRTKNYVPRQKPESIKGNYKPLQRLSPSRVAWLLVKKPEVQSEEEQKFLEVLWQQCPKVKRAYELAQEFVQIVRKRESSSLNNWILQTHQPEIPHELRVFAGGLRRDFEAVQAALNFEWNNGQLEGQINRLKLIKRQMYGRAGFELLRRRVLNTG